MEKQLVTITHPSNVQFNVHLTTYELNRKQIDPDFLFELTNKYYSLYKKGLIFGTGKKNEDISVKSGPSTSSHVTSCSLNAATDTQAILFEDIFDNSVWHFFLHLLLENNQKENYKALKLWSDKETLLLISLVKKYNEELEQGIKKFVWRKISKEIFQEINKQYTIIQIRDRVEGPCKNYKNITCFNNTSGNTRKEWKFYIIHEILYKKPEISPVAILVTMD